VIDWLRWILKPLASLKLTVALFAMAMFLIFAGTLAQVEQGTFQAMDNFFRTWVAWVKLDYFVPQKALHVFISKDMNELPGGFWFPGGITLISLILINLVAAHSVRFKLKLKQTGILLTHAGLILLLGSELVTGAFATEGNMRIREGSYSNYVERMRDYELAVIKPAAGETGKNRTTVVPDSILLKHLEQNRGPISHPDLPFKIKVERWMNHTEFLNPRRGSNNPATAGFGRSVLAEAAPPPSGTDANQSYAIPSAYITLLKDGQSLGTYLVSAGIPRLLQTSQPQKVEVDGTTYRISLRFRRVYKPFTMHLVDFTHAKFTGTETPKAFKSRIRLENPSRNERREVLIQMNEPLHYQGQTFYQSGYMRDNKGTILQVVDNPAWLLPYISCAMIGGGLLVHFGITLVGFLRRQF
jgi:hypothetical protein